MMVSRQTRPMAAAPMMIGEIDTFIPHLGREIGQRLFAPPSGPCLIGLAGAVIALRSHQERT